MQDAQTANQPQTEVNAEKRAPLPLREDTIFGVCEGLGEDFGFNPLLLRIALGAGLLWNPVAIVAIYFGLGALVMISRFLFPTAGKTASAAPAEPIEVRQDNREPERIAA